MLEQQEDRHRPDRRQLKRRRRVGQLAARTVKIGFEGPLSGDNAQLGINEVNAVELAVDQANSANTFGFKVTLVKSDDVGDPAKAPAAATTLQQDPAILGVIGPSFSGATKAVGASYDAANLVLISPSATNPTLTTLGFKSFHRVVPPDSLEGKEAGDYLAKKAKKVFVVDDLSDYGKGAADAVETELKAKSIPTERQGVDAKTTDYSVIANQVKASGDDALFYGGYDTQAAQFAKALKAAAYTGITMTGNGGKSSKFTSGAGDAGDGWLFSCGCLDATVAPQAKAFSDAYKAAFNTDPVDVLPRGIRRDERAADGDQGGRCVADAGQGVRGGQRARLQGHHHARSSSRRTARSPRRSSTCTSRTAGSIGLLGDITTQS